MDRPRTTLNYKDMPCGHCDAGTYAFECVIEGIKMFGECQTQKDALRAAPRCKSNGRKICMGARDFIVGETFPLDVQKIMEELNAA